MKYLLTLLTLLSFLQISYSQGLCARFAEVESEITRKVILEYDNPQQAQAACDAFDMNQILLITIDDVDFEYQILICDAENLKVVLAPVMSDPTIPLVNTMTIAFPNGDFATYNSPVTTEELYRSSLTGCEPGPRPIPTMSQWGFIALTLLIGIFGFNFVRQRVVKVA